MTALTKDQLHERLQALVGTPTDGVGKRSHAPDPVNAAMIRHWAYALDDMNPAYLDPEFAESSRYGGLVSPPVMLQSWTMPPPKLAGIHERGGVPIEIKTNPLQFLSMPVIRASSRRTRSSRLNVIHGWETRSLPRPSSIRFPTRRRRQWVTASSSPG